MKITKCKFSKHIVCLVYGDTILWFVNFVKNAFLKGFFVQIFFLLILLKQNLYQIINKYQIIL